MVSSFLSDPPPIALAHRGYAPDGAENSMDAFARAVALGYRYLETDVRVTADGVALAFHDSTLDRVTDQRGRVDRMPWSQLRHARIAGREPIPLLADVLGTWPDVRVNLDVKSDRGVAPAVAAIRQTGAVRRVCVAAFAGHRITAVRRALGPDVCTALGPADALSLRFITGPADRLAGRRFAGRCTQVPPRIGLAPLVDRRYVRVAHRLGLAVHVWTVNRRSEMVRLLDLGVDGIVTDQAELLREVLVERGQWPR